MAVAILHSNGSSDDVRLSDALAANDVAVVCIPTGVDFEEGVRLADDLFPSWLPRMVAASGGAVPVAQKAARRAGLSSAVLLNAPVGRSLGRDIPATIVFVDRELLSGRMWSRMASRLGNASFHVIDESFDAPLRHWLCDPANVSRDSLAPRVPKMAVAALVAAASIVAVPVALPVTAASAPAVAAADPFDGGVAVDARRIDGDGVAESRAAKEDSKSAGTDEGTAVPSTSIQGDGIGDGTGTVAALTGDLALVGGNKLEWFINTDITDVTTSSASAAASEASFTGPGPVTTLNGGVVSTTLSDAFDGYNSLFVDLPTEPIGTDTNNYNQTGAAPTLDASADAACAGRQASFPVLSMQGLDVSRKVFVPSDGDYARWLNVLSNPTAAPITVRVGTANNLGSDGDTMLVNSSNGNATAELTDTWVTSMEAYSGLTSADVRLGHVLQGPGAEYSLDSLDFADGENFPFWTWLVTVQPGETISLMNFAVGANSKADAAASAAKLAALDPTVGPLRCLTDAEKQTISNFELAENPVPPTIGPDPIRYTPITPFRAVDTRSGSGGLLAAETTRKFVLPDRPVGAVAATVNVTMVNPSAAGFATLYPCDQSPPPTSNVNYPAGGATPNQATISLSAAGELCVFTSAASDVLIDVNGWWSSQTGGAVVKTQTPTRVFDSRPALRPAGSTLVIDLAGKVPASAVAASMNVTTVGGAPGYVTLYTCGEPLPNVSNVNQVPGIARPNLATVKLSADKTVCAFSSSETALIVDLLGAWVPGVGSSGLTLDPTPDRVYDSRVAGGPLSPTVIRQVVPAGTGTLFINLTATVTAAPGFMAAFPCDDGYTGTSNVNFAGAGESSSTAVIVDSSRGGVCVYSSVGSQVVVDVFATATPPPA